MSQIPQDLVEILRQHGQEHLIQGWDALIEAQRKELKQQLASIDFGAIRKLYENRDASGAALPPRQRIQPIPVQPEVASGDMSRMGEESLRRGEVAALLVAGGQGTRLNFDKPKGMYPIGAVSSASLFRIHAEKVLATSQRYEAPVPLLVMTSPATHEETESHFREERFFGLPSNDVFFFRQGTMPSVDLATGKILLEKPGKIFLSPNGHGGALTALAESGVLSEIESRGIRHVFYFQVDNPLVKICDPSFIAFHIAAMSQASSKVVYKEKPEEKVGVFAEVDGRCSIIEYSDMPAEMAAERDERGDLRFRAGNPAIHIFTVEFLRWLTGSNRLPYHLARKKVPYYDLAAGQPVSPATENALKFELFMFDALPLADRWLAMETSREEEFAPLKNATGADSPDSVRQAMSRLHARWLRASGASIPETPAGDPSYPVEISPLYALDEAECKSKVKPHLLIAAPSYLR